MACLSGEAMKAGPMSTRRLIGSDENMAYSWSSSAFGAVPLLHRVAVSRRDISFGRMSSQSGCLGGRRLSMAPFNCIISADDVACPSAVGEGSAACGRTDNAWLFPLQSVFSALF